MDFPRLAPKEPSFTLKAAIGAEPDDVHLSEATKLSACQAGRVTRI
jgi:hypothetical protein